jgi:lipoprotein-releasing system ATP-binding protein
MLKLNRITKSFPQRGLVLENLSLEVNEGDSISITGPSGSGKTTIMNIIGLLDKPDTGEVFFREKPLNMYTEDEAALYRNSNIGFVFQDSMLMAHLTVAENILLPVFATKTGAAIYKEALEWAENLMERTGIRTLRDKYPSQISGGEAQRTAVVRALIRKPSIVLADEPTGALDQKNAEHLGDLLIEINKDMGTAIIVTTHSPLLAEKMKMNFRIADGKLVN